MLKFCISIFILAVLLGEGESDPFCILAKVRDVEIATLFNYPKYACRDIQYKFDHVRESLKNCTLHKINIDRLECLFNDFCTVNSTFRRDFNKSRRCLSEHLYGGEFCVRNMLSKDLADFQNVKDKSLNEAYEICTRVANKVLDCLQEVVAEPCGEEAVKVFRRMIESSKSIAIGTCIETAGVEAGEVRTETPELECILEDTASGAKSSFVWITSYWSILLEALIAVMWGHLRSNF